MDKSLAVIRISWKFYETGLETVGRVVVKSLVEITISRKFDETQLETVG